MAGLRELIVRLAGLVRRHRWAGDRSGGPDRLDAEIRTHLLELEEAYRRKGLTPENAQREARLVFGNTALVREAYDMQRTLPGVESILHDARYAARLLRRHPGFTLTAVLTLSLGIGLNTTLFTTINAVMFRSLPVRDGDRLVRFERWFASQRLGNGQYLFSEQEYEYIRDHRGSLADVIAASDPVAVDAKAAEPIRLQTVSSNYFQALGAPPVAGRVFTPADTGDALGVVLSYPYWQHQYGADPSVVGRAIRLNQATVTIAGVAPASFIGTGNPPSVPDVWAPIELSRAILTGDAAAVGTASTRGAIGPYAQGAARRFQVLAYVAPGDLTAASGAVALLVAPMGNAFPSEDATTALTPEHATFFGETNDPRFHDFVAALMTAVGLVLVIACANLANMLLARATGRHKEIAMRLALGASRRRVIRQLLTESLLLALLGGAGGLLFSLWGARMLWVGIAETIQLFLHGQSAFSVSLTPDLRVFAYTFAVSMIAGIVFGLAPALRASKRDLNSELKEEGTGAGQGVSRSWLRSTFVASQVAVSMALLLVAGLLLRGFEAARRAEPGYDVRHLYAVLFERPADTAAAAALQALVAQRLAARSEVANVALVDRVPMAGTWTPPVQVQRQSGRFAARTLAAHVSAEYFPELGIRILRGRNFTRDEQGAVAILSQRGAALLWPGEDPVGRTLTLDMDFHGSMKTFEVIGIAADVRTSNLSRIDPSFAYLPVDRAAPDTVLVRITGDPQTALNAIRNELRAINPDLAVRAELINVADGWMRLQRLSMTALTAIAATLAFVALALSVAGIYGVVSYLAGARRFEVGVRMALGARPIDALKLVVSDSLRPVVLGAAIGLCGALALSTVVRASLSFPGTPDVLFGVSAFDATSFAGATALLAAVALAASAGPLWRATRVDPVIALRH